MAASPSTTPPLWPIAVLIVAIACFQSGGSLSKTLFPLVGAPGATALRLSIAALILLAINRPWREGRIARSALAPLLLYGVAMAGLNGFFFLSLQTIPLGIAVAIDFLGPLGVVVAYSRRPIDGCWALLAAIGVATLLPRVAGAAALDARGLVYCFCAAGSWALYILAGRAVGARLSNGRATALGLTIAAVLVLPFGMAEAGWTLLSWEVLPMALLVAVLSSALPYRLEMVAMTRMPARVFGVLMCLEPAMGSLFGWVLLGEHLTVRQGGAIILIILASAGATLTAERPVPATPV